MLKYFLALFLLVVIYNQVVESKCTCIKKICGKGWNLKRGRCYVLFRHRRTWRQAFFNCWRKGGYLVKINSRKEYLAVRRMTKQFWIDGKRACYKNKRSFTFAMSTGRFGRPYTSFRKGQPNNRRGRENCLQITRRYMFDSRCSRKMRYVCEKAPKVRK